MIFDRKENIDTYKGISEGLDKAFAFLEHGATELEAGIVLDLGDGMTARCLSYQPGPYDEGIAEAHRVFIDVMLMKKGREQIGYKPTSELKNITQEYMPDKDALLAKEERMDMLPFEQGCVAVFFPQDAHMPGVRACEECGPEPVERIVVKVPV